MSYIGNIFRIEKATGLGFRNIDYRKVCQLSAVLDEYTRHKRCGYSFLSKTPDEVLTSYITSLAEVSICFGALGEPKSQSPKYLVSSTNAIFEEKLAENGISAESGVQHWLSQELWPAWASARGSCATEKGENVVDNFLKRAEVKKYLQKN